MPKPVENIDLISIHAPAKGATLNGMQRAELWKFQSTLPRRERQELYAFLAQLSNFNPRSREGSDLDNK